MKICKNFLSLLNRGFEVIYHTTNNSFFIYFFISKNFDYIILKKSKEVDKIYYEEYILINEIISIKKTNLLEKCLIIITNKKNYIFEFDTYKSIKIFYKLFKNFIFILNLKKTLIIEYFKTNHIIKSQCDLCKKCIINHIFIQKSYLYCNKCYLISIIENEEKNKIIKI